MDGVFFIEHFGLQAVTFNRCENLKVFGLNVMNAQQMHVRIEQSVNAQAYNVMLTAPEKSPNTDGIHVTASQNVQIISSIIRTGKARENIIEFGWLKRFFFFFNLA